MDPIRANSILANATLAGSGVYSFAAAQRAYGSPSRLEVTPPSPAANANAAGGLKEVARAFPRDVIALESKAQAAASAGATATAQVQSSNTQTAPATRLVAAGVPGRVDFSQPKPKSDVSGALPFYRNPSERNTVATQVALGRGLDVTG